MMTGQTLPLVKLGKTDIDVSPIGLGTVKFGRNEGVKYPLDFSVPDDIHISVLLAQAKSLGINMLDTAPAYGQSEERLGEILYGQRKDWVIVGKAGEEFEDGKSTYIFTPDHFQMSLERSLKRLKTDHLDVLLIHSDGNDMDILENDALMKKMHSFKEQGLVRAIGASTKTVEGGMRALDTMDVVMACYNPVYTDEERVLDHAGRYGGAVLLKKLLASGHVDKLGAQDDPVQHAMDFAFSHNGVTSAIIGTINPYHLRENVMACLRSLEKVRAA